MNKMAFGLTNETIGKIISVFEKYPETERVIIYGSRAIGNYQNGSDIDLTLVGKNLTLQTLYKIENDLDDLLLPYTIDLSIYERIENENLLEHINRVGEVFFEKDYSSLTS